MPNISNISKNISFSGCGFLISFHIGVAKVLKKANYFDPLHSKFAGASGGSLVALALASNWNLDRIEASISNVTKDCREKGSFRRLESALMREMEFYKSHISLEQIHGRLTIATTSVWPTPQVQLIQDFESTEDLIETILTSCYLPGYSAPRFVRKYRQGYSVDGGLITFAPDIPGYLKVYPFPLRYHRATAETPSGSNNTGIITPSILEEKDQISIRELIQYSIQPPPAHMVQQLYQNGQRAAEAFLESAV